MATHARTQAGQVMWKSIKMYAFGIACGIGFIIYAELLRHWFGAAH